MVHDDGRGGITGIDDDKVVYVYSCILSKRHYLQVVYIDYIIYIDRRIVRLHIFVHLVPALVSPYLIGLCPPRTMK